MVLRFASHVGVEAERANPGTDGSLSAEPSVVHQEGGDDFTQSVWEHGTIFEPTLVFPFEVYFAEAVGATIYALPHPQFCLQKNDGGQFAFVDFTGKYDDLGLRNQFLPAKLLKITNVGCSMPIAMNTRDLFFR